MPKWGALYSVKVVYLVYQLIKKKFVGLMVISDSLAIKVQCGKTKCRAFDFLIKKKFEENSLSGIYKPVKEC